VIAGLERRIVDLLQGKESESYEKDGEYYDDNVISEGYLTPDSGDETDGELSNEEGETTSPSMSPTSRILSFNSYSTAEDIHPSLFDDGYCRLSSSYLTLRIYWFPLGQPKVIDLSAIKSVHIYRPRHFLALSGWGWGADHLVWWNCDLT
jgi:hypothetical protein